MVRPAQLTVVLLAMSVVLAPAATALEGCDEAAGELCCAADCVLCACCAHLPAFTSKAAVPLSRFAPATLATPTGMGAVSAHPRDIFHVPIAPRSR